MKKIIMVRHADGKEEVVCPNCGGKMEFHYGLFSESLSFGEYCQSESGDTFDCLNCGYSEEA
jgi:predicted RNA-binding Zn-ribbon protein involved in translation (DUF1610 family)